MLSKPDRDLAVFVGVIVLCLLSFFGAVWHMVAGD